MFSPGEALILLVIVGVLIVATVSIASFGLIWLENRQERRNQRAGKVTIDLAHYLDLLASKTALDLLEPAARRAEQLLVEGEVEQSLSVLSGALHAPAEMTETYASADDPAPSLQELKELARPSTEITTDPRG